MSDSFWSFSQVTKEWARSPLVTKFSGLILKMDRISPLFFLDRVPQRIATKFPRWERERERERESFFYTLDFRRYAKICEKGYIYIYISIYYLWFFSDCLWAKGEKLSRLLFPIAFIPNVLSLSFSSFSIFFSSNELSFPLKLQCPRDQCVKSIFLAVGIRLSSEHLKISDNERKDRDATRIENDGWK